MEKIQCIGCGALVDDCGGPTFRYPNAASPGCWKVYGEILAKEYSEYRYPEFHRLTVDAYAIQHPGDPTPQTTQSVNVHLAALYLVIEKKLSCAKATDMMGKLVRLNKGAFEWLPPPRCRGGITVVDVAGAVSFEEHRKRVYEWAHAAYSAWSSHYGKIANLVHTIGD